MQRNSASDSDRVALVTGGAKGIGAEVCERLCAAGMAVLVADLEVQAAERTAAALREAGGNAAAIELDVAQPESVAAAFAKVEADYGRCDVLVNCAGITRFVPHADLDALMTSSSTTSSE